MTTLQQVTSGTTRRRELLRQDYVWPSTRTDWMQELRVAMCTRRVRNKSSRHRPYGLLQPLPTTLALDQHGLHQAIARFKWVYGDFGSC
jgi:hypothetical protein